MLSPIFVIERVEVHICQVSKYGRRQEHCWRPWILVSKYFHWHAFRCSSPAMFCLDMLAGAEGRGAPWSESESCWESQVHVCCWCSSSFVSSCTTASWISSFPGSHWGISSGIIIADGFLTILCFIWDFPLDLFMIEIGACVPSGWAVDVERQAADIKLNE